MAIFFQLYYSIPSADYKKTTLQNGNPHRFDHLPLGMTAIQASLYKPPKNKKIIQYWLWDDPGFDPMDTQPSERVLVKKIYDFIAQEMERVLQDKQVNFPNHHLVGTDLQRQLGFLYSRAINYQLASSEILFHVLLGATPIELSQIAAAQQKNRKHLKPVYLPSIMKQLDVEPLIRQKNIDQAYTKADYDKISAYAESDITGIMHLYYKFLS